MIQLPPTLSATGIEGEEDGEGRGEGVSDSEDEGSQLLTCSSCLITVHKCELTLHIVYVRMFVHTYVCMYVPHL